MHDLRAVLLCHAVVKAQGYHLPLALRQRLYRSAQRNIFNKLVLRAVVAEDKLKREAVLPRLALDTVGRPSRRLGKGNVLGRYARLARKPDELRVDISLILAACSLMPRLTLTVPSSRRKRRISPDIFGTA